MHDCFDACVVEQVIDNCRVYYYGVPSYSPAGATAAAPAQLAPPAGCPREIYDLMCECWQRDDSLRPSFREIHMFLQRKNMGYSPRDDRLATSASSISFV